MSDSSTDRSSQSTSPPTPQTVVLNSEGYEVYRKDLNSVSPPKEKVNRLVEEQKWLTRIDHGQYIFHEKMTNLLIAFQEMTKVLAKQLGYVEWIFPRLQTDDALRAFGWTDMSNLRPELLRVVPFENDGTRLNNGWFLDPLQCTSFYRYLKTISPVPATLTPMKIYEWRGGWTYRNEKKDRIMDCFETCLEFSGLEMVFVGDEEFAKKTRFDNFNFMTNFVEQLEMDYRIVVGSSCSHKKEGHGPTGDEIMLNDVPTIDVQVKVPQDNKYIEIGGSDYIGTRLINNFGISASDQSQLHSGCQGIGWQRLAKGFLAQKGTDPKSWPKSLLKYFQA